MPNLKERGTVRTNSNVYEIMSAKWQLLYDLMGGTPTMRERGETWLPREPKESEVAYGFRLNRTFLYNAYKRTIKALVGSAFMRPITVSNLPPELEYLVKDADGAGRSLTAVAALLAEHMLITGKAQPFVDFPQTDGEVTVADFKKGGVRPFINPIDPRDLFAWHTEYAGGVEHITEIRFLENTLEQYDEWTDVIVERIRVVRPDEFILYRQDIDDQTKATIFVEEERTPNTLGFIPLVPIYENKVATLVSDPPLEDLAWLNLRHWQSSSDQNNILHVARVPLLLWTGFKEGSLNGLEIGANRAVVTDAENAKGAYVEHTGAAINAGKEDIKNIEEQMSNMGSDILTMKSVSRQTASARAIDQAESMSTFQVILRNLEEGLEQCFKIAGKWINVNADDVKVSIGDDLGIAPEANAVSDLNELELDGTLTPEEKIQELKRRSIVAPSVTE